MELSLKPDFDKTKKRIDAFWHCEIVDRPPVSIILPKENPSPLPHKEYKDHRERWLDIEFRAELLDRELENNIYFADGVPTVFPNMGPEIFSAWCGCPYQFGETTTWSEPCIIEWETDSQDAVFNPEHPLFKATVEFTRLLIERGKDKFIVGLTDFHPGGDHLAALRDPANLAIDLIENLDYVIQKLEESYKEYFHVYDIFYNMIRDADMPITSWTPLFYEGRYYIPSNDFSCMISKEMFDEIFLPGIIEECKFYDRSIYHLDGPDALRHLDSILDIEELNAVQWICGAGNEGYVKWIDVYRKIQDKGKGIQLQITLEELPLVFETLKPEGVWFSSIYGIDDMDTAERVVKRIEAWK